MTKVLFCYMFSAPCPLVGVSVSAMCDGTTGSKLQQCALDGNKAMKMAMTSNNFDAYCASKSDATECMKNINEECSGNPKEQKMIDLMVNIDDIQAAIGKICDNKTESLNSINSCTESEHVQEDNKCLEDAKGVFVNKGKIEDAKGMMDVVCTYFESMSNCYAEKTNATETCKDHDVFFSKVFKVWEYPYCALNNEDRTEKLYEYKHNITSGAYSQYSYSVLSLVSVIVIPAL